MEPNQEKLKEYKGKAQTKFDGIARDVLDSDASLVVLLVKAFRQGHDPTKAREVFTAMRVLVEDAKTTYEAAIAQPEARISQKSRVTL